MKLKYTLTRIAALCLIILCTVPGLAQESTHEPTVEAAPIAIVGEGTTVEDGGVNVTVNNPAPTGTVVDDSAPVPFTSMIVSAILGAIVGATAALASAASWIKAATNDPVKMTLAEAAAGSVSKETHERALDFIQTLLAFTKEATDGVPMVAKPKPATTTPATPYAMSVSGIEIPVEATASSSSESAAAPGAAAFPAPR